MPREVEDDKIGDDLDSSWSPSPITGMFDNQPLVSI